MPEPITDLIPEVRAALAKATPEQWVHETCDEGCCHYYDTLTTADANLIANAPAWLEALCDEVERLAELVAGDRLVEQATILARGSELSVAEAIEAFKSMRDQHWRDRAEKAEAAIKRARGRIEFLIDVAEQEHIHPEGAGTQECPGCWVDELWKLLAALDGE